jgi:hypothetical protein
MSGIARHTVQTIVMYHRTYPVAGAPVTLSLRPYPTHQRHTFAVGTKTYEAVFRELKVQVPDDAKVDQDKNLLLWTGKEGKMQSTAAEVLGFAESGATGFRTVK